MKKVMVCPKNTGNTHKVCDYVSRKLGIELKVVDGTTGTNLEDCDVVILSSGVYGNHVHENLQTWINSISDGDIKPNAKFYVFFTWFGRGKSIKTLPRGPGIMCECFHYFPVQNRELQIQGEDIGMIMKK